MNVQEMHIDVNLGSQKIASNVNRKFDPAEIDWLANREVERFIKDRIKKDRDSPGFEADEVDMDAIRTLVVNDEILLTRKKALTDDTVFAWLPGNYSYLIDDFSIVVEKCNREPFAQAMNFTTVSEYIYAFPLKKSALTSGPYYVAADITLNGDSVWSESAGPGLPTADELFTYRYRILDNLWALDGGNTTWYWERYGDFYKPGCILAVMDNAQTTNSITIDGVTTDAVETIKTYLSAPVISGATLMDRVPNRLIRGSVRSNVLSSAFGATNAGTPVSSLDRSLLRAYHDERFTVNSLIISYIRKPRKINLSLSMDCDLPEEFHSQIVDRVVLTIKELTKDPDWQVKLQDLMLNKD